MGSGFPLLLDVLDLTRMMLRGVVFAGFAALLALAVLILLLGCRGRTGLSSYSSIRGAETPIPHVWWVRFG